MADYEEFKLEDEHTLWKAAERRLATFKSNHAARSKRWGKRKEHLQEMEEEIMNRLGQWSGLRSRIQQGHVVKMPPQHPAKRKASSAQRAPPTKRATRRGCRLVEATEIESGSDGGKFGKVAITEDPWQALAKGPDMPPVGDPLDEAATKSMILHLNNMENRLLKEMTKILEEHSSSQMSWKSSKPMFMANSRI